MAAFETSDRNPGQHHRPVKVPIRKHDVFGAAKELCADLDGWTIVGTDEEALTISCERRNGLLGGTSRILVSVEGPDDIPSSQTHVRSETSGALLPKDKAIVAEFVKKFTMRVC